MVKWWDLDTQHCFKTMVGHRTEVRVGSWAQEKNGEAEGESGFLWPFPWAVIILRCLGRRTGWRAGRGGSRQSRYSFSGI